MPLVGETRFQIRRVCVGRRCGDPCWISSVATSNGTRWRLGLWLGYWLLLFVVMHTPLTKPPTPSIPHVDKAVHFFLYFLLAWLCSGYHRARGRYDDGTLAVWVGVFLVYAVVDECLQPLVGRTRSVYDWAADAAGVLTAALLSARSNRSGLSDRARPAREAL